MYANPVNRAVRYRRYVKILFLRACVVKKEILHTLKLNINISVNFCNIQNNFIRPNVLFKCVFIPFPRIFKQALNAT